MFKRFGLLIVTNILILVTLSVLAQVLGINRWLTARGVDYQMLAAFCLLWGFGGAFISLAISRIMAKFAMGVQVIDPRQPGQFGELVDTVHRLAQKAGLPAMPEVGIYDSPEINAFATGPSKSRSLVAVSTGLLHRMNRDERDGVLGHEVAHIANGDMVTMTLIQGVVNAFVMFLARAIAIALSSAGRRDGEENGGHMNYLVVFVLEMLFSFLGMFVVAWFSRYREYRADAGGARVAGKEKMVGALAALNRFHGVNAQVETQPSVATLKISGKAGGLMALLSTHPPLEDRIARLQAAR
jgi:heat shock protein HtpX